MEMIDLFGQRILNDLANCMAHKRAYPALRFTDGTFSRVVRYDDLRGLSLEAMACPHQVGLYYVDFLPLSQEQYDCVRRFYELTMQLHCEDLRKRVLSAVTEAL